MRVFLSSPTMPLSYRHLTHLTLFSVTELRQQTNFVIIIHGNCGENIESACSLSP